MNKQFIDNQIETLLTSYIFEISENETFDNIDEDIFTILSNNNINHYDIDFNPNYDNNSLTINIKGNNVHGTKYKSTFTIDKKSILTS